MTVSELVHFAFFSLVSKRNHVGKEAELAQTEFASRGSDSDKGRQHWDTLAEQNTLAITSTDHLPKAFTNYVYSDMNGLQTVCKLGKSDYQYAKPNHPSIFFT